MGRKIDRQALLEAVNQCAGLSAAQKEDLRQLLTEQKKYGLVWEDKPEQAYAQLRDIIPVMMEDKSKAIINCAASPNHVIIEGDNLHALTNLAYTHAGKIDVIYIDPPYNTGNKDFVYNDRFVDKNDGFRHSEWLSFMEKRLKLAKQLLSDKGVIFISIDDNEQAQLKMLCNDIFGEGNFVCDFIWKSKSGGANDSRYVAVDHEYILCYGKNVSFLSKFMDDEAEVTTSYNRKDKKGYYSLDRLDKQSIRYSDSLNYEIIGPDGRAYWPKHKDPANPNATWRWSKEHVKTNYKDLVFLNGNIYTKNYKKESSIARSILYEDRFGRTRTGKTDFFAIMKNNDLFSSPKPIKLLRFLMNITSNNCATVLDFFAGSGTTLDATMKLNAEDGGHRQCILVTNNENGICENVTYPRNKKVIEGYRTPKGEWVEGLKNNNLRYFRMDTDSVRRDGQRRSREQLATKMVDMLRLKHNIYTPHDLVGTLPTNPPTTRYYQDGGRGLLILMEPGRIGAFVAAIKEMEIERIYVYVYSDGVYGYEAEFAALGDKVEVNALPTPFLNVFKRVAPPKSDNPIPTPNRELTEQEAAQSIDDYKDTDNDDTYIENND